MKYSKLATALAFLVIFGAVQAQTPPPAPKVKVAPAMTAKAGAPAPGAAAKNSGTKSSLGKGATSIKTVQPSAFWSEEVDVDDDGAVETSDFLFDAQRGMLFSYREDDFLCANGSPESGSILTGLYAKNNTAGKPIGSGWYLVNVDKGKCASKESKTFGCRFDASGNPTECGAAVVNEATGEIDLVVAK